VAERKVERGITKQKGKSKREQRTVAEIDENKGEKKKAEGRRSSMGLQVKSDVGRDWERSWKKKGWAKEKKDKGSVSDQSRSHLSQIICTVMFMFMCHNLCVIEKSYLNHTKQGIGAKLAPWCGILEASTVLTYPRHKPGDISRSETWGCGSKRDKRYDSTGLLSDK
jgi:hypothetical protein